MNRRSVIKLATGVAALSATLIKSASAHKIESATSILAQKDDLKNVVYIPGYWPGSAYFEGVAALDHQHLGRALPKNYKGSIRLLTRLESNGEVTQALFPVHGHDVEISPDGKIGFFGSLEHNSYVCFDPQTLDLIALGQPWKKNWIGGGHGIFVDDGKLLAISERAPKVGYRGNPSRHYGRITLRDPQTLKTIESYSTHGVSPHDVRLLKDGKHLAIANYGSTYPRKKKKYGVPRHIVEPSVTVIDVNDGKLVAKYLSASKEMELRHLCAHNLDTIFAIQTSVASAGEDQPYHKTDKAAYEAEFTVPANLSYRSAPTIRADSDTGKLITLGSKPMQNLMRHGLSIHYEPTHDEVIATYPASHSIMVYDARSGEIKHHIDCTKNGLNYPCGVTLLPGSNFYAVAGYWKDLYIFEAGSHKLMRELCHYTTFFGHSHITAT